MSDSPARAKMTSRLGHVTEVTHQLSEQQMWNLQMGKCPIVHSSQGICSKAAPQNVSGWGLSYRATQQANKIPCCFMGLLQQGDSPAKQKMPDAEQINRKRPQLWNIRES